MNIDKLKYIDTVFGKIILFFLYCVFKTKQLIIHPRKCINNPNKILFIKFFGIGSITLLMPTIHRFKKIIPAAQIGIVTLRENQAFVNMCKMIDKSYILNIERWYDFISSLFKSLFYINRDHWDIVIDCEFFANFSAIFCSFTNIKERWGFKTFRNYRNFIYHKTAVFNHTGHVSLSWYRFTKLLDVNIKIPNRFNDIEVSPNKILNFDFRQISIPIEVRPLSIGININSGSLYYNRRWPIKHFKSMIELLYQYFTNTKTTYTIYLTGSPSERYYVERFQQGLPSYIRKNVINISGRLSLKEYIVFLSKLNLFISNDSGPIHLARLLNIPTVGLFGPESPFLYGYNDEHFKSVCLNHHCSPCLHISNNKSSDCKDNQCMSLITPEMVFREAISLLPPNHNYIAN